MGFFSNHSENEYSVVAKRVTCEWFQPTKTLTFYVPRYKGRPFADVYPSVWGFDSEAEAWKACEEHEEARINAEEDARESYANAVSSHNDRETMSVEDKIRDEIVSWNSRVILYRDGKEVLRGTEIEVVSYDNALRHEGYSVVKEG